jgi:dTDP-4-amino-4,6-dideoxygalactose transaminase
VATLAATHGVPVIEDAAQGAGGILHGRRLGGFGAISVLSFGRGKGMTGGNGGALLAVAAEWEPAVSGLADRLSAVRSGWADLAGAAAQWVFGRPALYGIPASVPALRLGEMIYRPAHEPATMSNAAAALLCTALPASEREVLARRRHSATLERATLDGTAVTAIRPIPGGVSGQLRFPVLDQGRRAAAPELGVFRGYPRTLAEQEELRPALHVGEPALEGAAELRRSLFTLPTHGKVSAKDLHRLRTWLKDPGAVTG